MKREELTTPDGTPLDVATSAAIKCLRRGYELDALGLILQIAERFPWKAWRTLTTFAAEDVGIANPAAITTVLSCREAWTLHKKESSGPPHRLYFALSVMVLARSEKSREADGLEVAVRHLAEQGWSPAIPDATFDMHTREGRARVPRDQRLAQFLYEGAVVYPDNGPKDWTLRFMRWGVRQGVLDRERVEQQATEWDAAGRLRFGIDGYGSVSEEMTR